MIFEETVAFPLKFNQLKVINEHRKNNEETEESLVKDPMMKISYSRSAFKGDAFLIFAANQKISAVLEQEELSYEERANLIKSFMTLNKRSDFPDLTATVGQMLLEKKGIKDEEDTDWMFLNKEERARFAEDNKEVIERWMIFLDSVTINMPYALKGYVEQKSKEVEEYFGTIEDLTYVGLNIVNLLVAPGYLERYLSIPNIYPPKVFVEHLYEPVFSGYTLINVLASGHNSIFPFMVSMYQDWISEDTKKELASGDS